MPRHVAAFDFDGTLSKRDCLVPFLVRVAGVWRFLAAMAAELPRLLGVATGRTSRDELKAAVFARVLRGRSAVDVEAMGAEFATEILQRRLRADTVGRVEEHRRRGDELVVVSASLDVYLRHVGAALGFDGVCAVELEARDGVLTGVMAGGNVRGPAKVARLEEWLGESVDAVELWAYGDSAGDSDLLEAASHAVWVR
ncbi:MAG: HAD-IB family hydrolase [Acidimicrobiia bacterium]|nr:HAD-IB family hydrolase [Acidimicrobiia bacterium]